MAWFRSGGRRGLQLSNIEWNQRLITALDPLHHVVQLQDFTYVQQEETARIDGVVLSNTEDPETNVTLLEEVGRTIIGVHRDNHIRHSQVGVHVRTPGGDVYEFKRLMAPDVVSLEHLADHYGLPRHH